MVEEGRDVARPPINVTRGPFGVMWVYKYVVTMQIIMPEAWTGGGSVLWDKGIDYLLVPC